MLRILRYLSIALLALVLLAVAGLYSARAWLNDDDQAPESSTGRRAVSLVEGTGAMVVAANPLATQAGLAMLEAGGSAIDATIAVQAMLTLVEPQSSGIGGGAFMLFHEGHSGELTAWDGRETAPASATPELFVHESGEPYAFVQALVGGRSVGAPGVLRMLEQAHRAHGRLPWKAAFQPAIEAATEGFEVTPRLHALLARDAIFRAMPAARKLFYDDWGRALPVGFRLKNPELAATLKAIADGGADAFYEGEIANAIARTVAGAKQPSEWVLAANRWLLDFGMPRGTGVMASVPMPGLLTAGDIAGYAPEKREPVCIVARGYRICGHPPPTSGGITTLQILGILAARPELESLDPRSAEAAHLIAEAGDLAFADRNLYIGDPAFVDVPTEGLLSPEYLAKRAALIQTDAVMKNVMPGEFEVRSARLADSSPSLPSTSHYVVVDGEGSVVSITTSVENVFGSRLVSQGFVLNNQLTDFSFVPEKDGKKVANAVAAGKRPRSSMSPLIAYDAESGAPVLAIGSPGGSRIIGYVAQAAAAVLFWGLDPQAAVDLPHVVGRGGSVEVEASGWAPGELEKVRAGLEGLGHEVRVVEQNSGLHVIRLDGPKLEGGVDPRREGLALTTEQRPTSLDAGSAPE